MSAQRSPNFPAEATAATSPGKTRLATADSRAPVPDAANERTSFCVWNTALRFLSARSWTAMKAGARWYGIGEAMTWLTAGGSGVGPAAIRYSLL